MCVRACIPSILFFFFLFFLLLSLHWTRSHNLSFSLACSLALNLFYCPANKKQPVHQLVELAIFYACKSLGKRNKPEQNKTERNGLLFGLCSLFFFRVRWQWICVILIFDFATQKNAFRAKWTQSHKLGFRNRFQIVFRSGFSVPCLRIAFVHWNTRNFLCSNCLLVRAVLDVG